jgi:small basic protein
MKQHRFDPVSFVFGLVFLLAAVGAVFNEQIDWNVGVWVFPAAIMVLGIGLLASALRRSNQNEDA